MPGQSEEFLKRLVPIFRIEADEHLKIMTSALIELEKSPPENRQAEIIETIYREAHSLKGAARTVNFREIESICQTLESVFSGLKSRRLTITGSLFELLYQVIDGIAGLLAPVPDGNKRETAGTPGAALVRRLEDALRGRDSMAAAEELMSPDDSTSSEQLPHAPAQTRDADVMHTPYQAFSFSADTVRVSTVKLDAMIRQAEEFLSPRLASAQRAKELGEVTAALASWKKQRSGLRPALRQIERYVNETGANNGAAKELQELPKLLEYMEAEKLFLKNLDEQLLRISKLISHDQRILENMTDSLLHDVKAIHLQPFFSLVEIFPRFTRELARDQGKQVELIIQGGELKIDRRILEEMKDPLIHILRNCIDHGIEPPALRRNKSKPAKGTITLAIAQTDNGKVEILIADDGAGIEAAKLRAAACKLGFVSADEAEQLGDAEAMALVFQSGISTSPIITDVSGRGLGLAIVREKVERLGGAVSLASNPVTGTSFRITLPLTLATFRGVLVCAGEQLFVIPAASVEQVMRIEEKDVRTMQNRETILHDGQAVSLVWLSEVLEFPAKAASAQTCVVILCLGMIRVAYRVEDILGEQEVLVKSLGKQLMRVRNVTGASVLGTGQVVPVLNVPDLLKSAVKCAKGPFIAASEKPEPEKPSILVVEDSITSRSLLKNILEGAGYQVTTAVDGADAYTAIKAGTFNLVVSDVEMPGMDGFELTARIRENKQLGELPVILITALDSREYRERGIDAGASAYIVKSSFDQSNLLEVIQRLI
ncbi:Hybrid sensor histidine kinase/response regulator [Candidatus Methylobacter favarea]|uniref:Chemotaxis protein CheA n=1 Tax=Candidatus Methylobacter favarea TaxID=2707345 RepID=A0A8S0WPC3_9GAMM|nr:hybrid sensor histidine kinase/response regulator [Candidatus Methylobacter favarea]CAA9890865.1 Hybrid sensor histidine kinase/response regulator [Candidatus Methylobacter favarea]